MDLLAFDYKLQNSMLAGMEIRVKIISIFILIMTLTSLQNLWVLASASGVLFFFAMMCGISPRMLMKRFFWMLPFVGLMLLFFPFVTPGEPIYTLHLWIIQLAATDAGVTKALMLGLRVLSAMLTVSLLVLTTPIPTLLQGFRQLRLPAILVSLADFTIRYLFVLVDEAKRMQLALRTRNFRHGKSFLHKQTMQTLGFFLGSLFIRAFERGERVYVAMLSRGYRMESIYIHPLRPTKRDLLLFIIIIGFAVMLKIMEWGV